MARKIKESLMLKWMVFSILLATIPLAIVGFSIIQIYQENLKKSVIVIEKEKANIVVERTRSFFEKITANLRTLSVDEHFRKGSSAGRIKNLMESFLYQNDYLTELTLLDERGKETIKVSKYKVFSPLDLKNQSKTGIFRTASNGMTYYGDFKLTDDIVPTMVIAVPIEEYRGRPTGVLSAEIHIRYLWNLIPQTQIGKKGTTYVVDSKGDLIAHPDTRRVLSRINVRHLPMVHLVVSGKEGNLEFEPSEGEKHLVVYRPIKELGWGVIVEVPVEEAYAPLRQAAHTALKWIFMTLCVAIIFSFFLTRKLIHPIKRLSDQMAKVSTGDFNVHIASTSKDELGLLTQSFNQMMQDLKQSQEASKEAERKYRKIFRDSKDMVFISSAKGEFIDVNQAGVEMLGYANKEELTQIHTKDTYLNSEERDKFVNEIMKEGFVKDFEVKLKRKDGISIDVLITANIRKDGSGETVGYEGIIKNITYRKNIEKELLQKTEELQALYDLSTLINQTLDLDRLLSISLEKTLSLTGFEMGTMHLLDKDGETLILKCYQGFSPVSAEKIEVLRYGEGAAWKALQLKRSIILPIGEYPTPRILPFLREEGIQLTVSIPLLTKGKGIGSMTLLSRTIHDLAQREIHLFESIGNQIGLAIENAKLFSDVAKAKSEWETTFDAVTDLITIKDKDYRFLQMNKTAMDRYGLSPDKIIGQKCFELIHHRDAPCEGCYVSETLRKKGSVSGERESQYLNGFFQYYTFPVYDEAEEIVAVVDLAREITEQKRLEIEKEVINHINQVLASSLDVRHVLKAVHMELKRVLDSERMTVTLLDEGGEGFRYFALEKDDEAGELVKDVIYPKEGTAFQKAVNTRLPVIVQDTAKKDSWINQQLLKEGIRSSLVFPMEYKGKVIGTVNLGNKNANHFSEDHARFLKQVVTGLVISIENSLLLDEIKASEEKYRTVVEGAIDGVLVVDEDYRFKYVNERLAEILGYSREELIGMDFRNCLNEESKKVADRYIRRQRREDIPPRYEFNVLRRDGEIRNVEISSTAMKDSKGNINTIAFIKDITEKKKMEDQLFQTEKLRALGEMTSGVAHDFNNALAAILGNAQLLLFTAKDKEVKEALQTIEKVAKDSAQTVRRLQDFTRKRTHQELLKLDINSIVKDAIEITKPKWKDDVQGRGIHIEMVAQFEEVPSVTGVASELSEVLTNMIFNAVEAMPRGGKIETRTFQKKGKVYIQISDTGVGMAEGMKKRIFEPFFTTKPFSNTGLGLSMSYGIINRFGGEIEVESKLEKGTTFTILLPVGVERKEEIPFTAEIKKEGESRILVIDDEESVRTIISKMLSQINYQVNVAKNGEEGIRLFRERNFDIVLTDLGMPGMSGWEVCKTIKKISPHLPVGMITGWGMLLDQEKIDETGLDFIISKPFDFNQILRVVGETIESKGRQFFSSTMFKAQA